MKTIAVYVLVALFIGSVMTLTACSEPPNLKTGVVPVRNVECSQHYQGQICKVTVLTQDTTRLYNAEHIQVLAPGEQFVSE